MFRGNANSEQLGRLPVVADIGLTINPPINPPVSAQVSETAEKQLKEFEVKLKSAKIEDLDLPRQ